MQMEVQRKLHEQLEVSFFMSSFLYDSVSMSMLTQVYLVDSNCIFKFNLSK